MAVIKSIFDAMAVIKSIFDVMAVIKSIFHFIISFILMMTCQFL